MTTTLKKQGGSLVVTVPAPARATMHLEAETVMTVTVDGNRLILEPALPPRPVHTLEERLAMCDFDAPLTDEENAWLNRPPVGRENLLSESRGYLALRFVTGGWPGTNGTALRPDRFTDRILQR